MFQHFKYRLIRTPLERPLLAARELMKLPHKLRYPELAEVDREPSLIKEVLARAIQPDTNCLDVGAHYGSVCSSILRLAPNAQHTAIEAVPTKAAFLRAKFPEFRVVECAVWAEPGTAEFFINSAHSGLSGLARHDEGDSFTKITVPRETLDSIMKDAPQTGFVKLDVEGAELATLESGVTFMRRHRPLLLFECGPTSLQSFGRTPAELYQLLTQDLTYDVYFMRDWLAAKRPVVLTAFEDALVYPFQAFNWIGQPR